jgi:hypothetical protein
MTARVVGLAVAVVVGGCGLRVISGDYACKAGEPGSCFAGWVCEIRAPSTEYRCYAEGAPHCGDGQRNGGEVCDGTDFGSDGCQARGFVRGNLRCSESCDQVFEAAHRRGVYVEVILDKSQRTERYSGADFLVNSGVATHIDSAHAIAHNRVMVVDSRVVLTGSFNFTRGAEERNAENLLVVEDGQLAERYAQNWRRHLTHATRYRGRSGADMDAPRPRGRR